MLGGFAELSAAFVGEVLSRKGKRPVRVRRMHVTDYADSPYNVRRATGLRKVDVETAGGSVRLMVKALPQPRDREALVWRFLQEAGDLPIPEVYHIESNPRQGVYGVILEYVGPLSETEVWHEDQCRRVGTALGRVHAAYWGRTDELPETFPAPQTPPEATVEPAVRRFLDRMSPRRHAILHEAVPDVFGFLARLLRMPPEFFEERAELPRTLIHGALDRSEVLFRPHGRGPEPVLIDWERARVGRGTEDLASLLNSLTVSERAAGRESLEAAYLDWLRSADIGIQARPLHDEIDRQRVLQAARRLPQLCRLYVDRRDEAAYSQWRQWFLDVAGPDAAELKKLLGELDRQDD